MCTLATANKSGVVSTAQMSLVSDGLIVYLQTDGAFNKVKNITENPNIAINCGAYNFKGVAKIVGHPKTNKKFLELIKNKHLKTYENYTLLLNEVLIEITLTECKIWDIDSSKNTNKKTITIVNFLNKSVNIKTCDKK